MHQNKWRFIDNWFWNWCYMCHISFEWDWQLWWRGRFQRITHFLELTMNYFILLLLIWKRSLWTYCNISVLVRNCLPFCFTKKERVNNVRIFCFWMTYTFKISYLYSLQHEDSSQDSQQRLSERLLLFSGGSWITVSLLCCKSWCLKKEKPAWISSAAQMNLSSMMFMEANHELFRNTNLLNTMPNLVERCSQ